MSKESSFDIVSQVDMPAMTDAIHQANKEIENRFDLKGTGCELTLEKETISVKAPDELKLKNVVDILENRMIKRNIPLKGLEHGKVEAGLGGTVKQTLTIRQGIDKDRAKKITNLIKEKKLKVQAQIQDDQIRVTGKSKDDLQTVIAALKGVDLDIELQFVNYR
ncbi:YajQ family cyclic di-GMP-binding protein [bacterium]|nr:YajQ family cyclic di-GMP-binding protein [bacterium]